MRIQFQASILVYWIRIKDMTRSPPVLWRTASSSARYLKTGCVWLWSLTSKLAWKHHTSRPEENNEDYQKFGSVCIPVLLALDPSLRCLQSWHIVRKWYWLILFPEPPSIKLRSLSNICIASICSRTSRPFNGATSVIKHAIQLGKHACRKMCHVFPQDKLVKFHLFANSAMFCRATNWDMLSMLRESL